MSTAPLPGWPHPESPFHDSERDLQARLGVEAKMEAQGRTFIRAFLPEQHRTFYAQLPFLLAGCCDAAGQPWASLLCGPPGFVRSPDAQSLLIALSTASLSAQLIGPLLDTNMSIPIGLLGIELVTRRRNRANGCARLIPEGLEVRVEQTFGNCPQYIQARAVDYQPPPGLDLDAVAQPRPAPAASLSPDDQAIISTADTFFIATANTSSTVGRGGGCDVSHRGGKPGFVRVDSPTGLTTPDFVGNFHFNTLGNLLVDARAGLLFVDWDGGTLLHVTATAEIVWDGPELKAFAAAERLVRFTITGVLRRPAALPLRCGPAELSPLLARTGDWDSAARSAAAQARAMEWRPFRVTLLADESSTIRSFTLEPADGGGVAPHQPGNHLPIRLPVNAAGEAVALGTNGTSCLQRTYTISDAANGRAYRISVKREGVASCWLHEHAGLGTIIEAQAPRGAFELRSDSTRPIAMLSAGVGVTPMIAILNTLLVNNGRSRHPAPIYFVHGARSSEEHAFGPHVAGKAARHSNLIMHVRYSLPKAFDAIGTTHHSVGHVDMALVQEVLPLDKDLDFYLCGPTTFMQVTVYLDRPCLFVSNSTVNHVLPVPWRSS